MRAGFAARRTTTSGAVSLPRAWRFAFVDRKLARYRWPVDATSLGHDRRRVELDELLMWFSFFLRHPGVPGPRRQLRVRLRRELDRLGNGSRPRR